MTISEFLDATSERFGSDSITKVEAKDVICQKLRATFAAACASPHPASLIGKAVKLKGDDAKSALLSSIGEVAISSMLASEDCTPMRMVAALVLDPINAEKFGSVCHSTQSILDEKDDYAFYSQVLPIKFSNKTDIKKLVQYIVRVNPSLITKLSGLLGQLPIK